ncbi:MAG: EamA family transporter [Pseudomonadota bacterium]
MVPSPLLIALLSATLFGLATPFSKLWLENLDPWLLAGLLYLGAGTGLGAQALLRRLRGRPEQESRLVRADLPWLAAAIFMGGMAAPVLLMLGLALTSGAGGSLLLNLESIATIAIAAMVFREHVGLRIVAGAVLIIAGALALSWRGDAFIPDAGALLILAACVAWGIDNNLTRRISAADPTQITMLRGLIAGSVNTGLALGMGAGLPAAEPLAAVFLTGWLGYGVSLVLFVMALRELGTARAIAYFSVSPFIGAAAAIPLLGDAVTAQLLLSGALMGAGVWLSLSEQHHHVHTHEALVHSHRHNHDDHHQHTHGEEVPHGEPHSHTHRHEPLTHAHPHWPDLHHRHGHEVSGG